MNQDYPRETREMSSNKPRYGFYPIDKPLKGPKQGRGRFTF